MLQIVKTPSKYFGNLQKIRECEMIQNSCNTIYKRKCFDTFLCENKYAMHQIYEMCVSCRQYTHTAYGNMYTAIIVTSASLFKQIWFVPRFSLCCYDPNIYYSCLSLALQPRSRRSVSVHSVEYEPFEIHNHLVYLLRCP